MGGGRVLGAFKLMGPAFLVSVAYLDPGNWATAVEAGSRFGYQLIWVVVLSNLIAILLQTLAGRLGLVTGKHLAEVCREQYPVTVCFFLWVMCEVSIVALDLTMVLGTAVGLNMLFGLPLLPCILLTSLDALMVFFMVPGSRLKWSEVLTVGLVGLVLICFLIDVVLSQPPMGAVVEGLRPKLERDSIYTAVSLLGANVMPHNFYLHSALVKGRENEGQTVGGMCHNNFIDVTCALGVALLINLAVLIVSAATFFSAGIVVETLQDAHDLMEQLLSSSIAPAVFGLALLFAGQLSTFTGTIAGQVVLKGFLNIEISPWLRRLATRSAAIIPAAILQQQHGDRGTYRMLVIAQVILALQLPFTLVPLIKATSERQLMGGFANSFMVQLLAWGSTALIFLASLVLFVNMLMPAEAADLTEGLGISSDFSLHIHRWVMETTDLAWNAPFRLVVLVLLVILASSSIALLLWMLLTPLSHGSKDLAMMPFFSKEFELDSKQQVHMQRKDMLAQRKPSLTQEAEHVFVNVNQIPQISTNPDPPQPAGAPPPSKMGRGSRRQLSTSMDKFWSMYFDLHGCPATPLAHPTKDDIKISIANFLDSMKSFNGSSTLMIRHSSHPWADIDDRVLAMIQPEAALENPHPVDVEPENGMSLLEVFGVWCMCKLLELCEAESRPELWGKYALVLNRLQWLLPHLKQGKEDILKGVMIKLDSVEAWVKSRKGPRGTSAGDIAFPKGKEIMISVVKRYRQKLGATRGAHRKGPTFPSSK